MISLKPPRIPAELQNDGQCQEMTDELRITKEGFKYFCWDGEIRQYTEQPIRSLLRCLRDTCKIHPDVTLGDIFKAVDRDEPLKSFLGDWAWCDVGAFHKEACLPTLNASDLHCIEIGRYFDWGALENAGATIHVSGSGRADENGLTDYGLALTPVNEIQHLPVVLKPMIEIRKDLVKIAEMSATFSLLDVLGEIYYEISFYGDPEERDERSMALRNAISGLKELKGAVREMKQVLAESIPVEAVDKRHIN